jgi:hypothetical protein
MNSAVQFIIAIAAKLEAAGIAAYNTRAPANTPLPYVVIGDIGEQNLGRFGGRLHQPNQTLHLWSDPHSGTVGAGTLYANVATALYGTLVAGEWSFYSTSVDLVGVNYSENDRAIHGIARARAWARKGT